MGSWPLSALCHSKKNEANRNSKRPQGDGLVVVYKINTKSKTREQFWMEGIRVQEVTTMAAVDSSCQLMVDWRGELFSCLVVQNSEIWCPQTFSDYKYTRHPSTFSGSPSSDISLLCLPTTGISSLPLFIAVQHRYGMSQGRPSQAVITMIDCSASHLQII